MNKNWKNFIKENRKKYMDIKHIICPAFDNEEIYFNNYGFDHLIYKGKRRRPKKDAENRLSLVSKTSEILKNAKSIYKQKRSIKGQSVAHFWEVRNMDKSGKVICIIIRKLNNGTKHFFSVFYK